MPYPLTACRPHIYTPAGGGAWYNVPGKTCLAAYAAKGAASYTASKLNLAIPGNYDLSDEYSTPPSWNATDGWLFTGTQWLSLEAHIMTTQGTIMCRHSDCYTPESFLFGSNLYYDYAIGFKPFNDTECSTSYWRHNATQSIGTPVQQGVIFIAGQYCYINGSLALDLGSIGASGQAQQIFIGAECYNGYPSAHIVANMQYLAIWDAVLSAAEVAERTAVIAAL
jgi:hypothetical protein